MIFTAGGGTISGVYSGSSTYMFSEVSSSFSSSFLASMSTFSFKSLMTFSRFPSLAAAPLVAGITGSVKRGQLLSNPNSLPFSNLFLLPEDLELPSGEMRCSSC